MQIRELNAFVEARGWPVARIFEDVASGTSTKRRPALAELMKLAVQRQIDVVVVWKIDRLARSLSDLVNMLNQLQEVGVEFVSLKDSIDLTTANGKLMMQLLAAFGEFEASMIKERVRAGIKNARMKGVKFGPPVQIDPTKVLSLRTQGHSIGQIATILNRSKGGIHKVLASQKFRSQQ